MSVERATRNAISDDTQSPGRGRAFAVAAIPTLVIVILVMAVGAALGQVLIAVVVAVVLGAATWAGVWFGASRLLLSAAGRAVRRRGGRAARVESG